MAINREEKKEVILFITNMKKTGQPVAKALAYYADNIAKKEELQSAISEIVRNAIEGKELEDLLYQYGFVNDFQYSILKNSKDKTKAYEKVLEITQQGNEVDKVYIKAFAKVFLSISATAFILPFGINMFEKMYSTIHAIKPDFKFSSMIQMTIDMKGILPYIGAVSLLLFILAVFFYFYSYRNSIELHYQLFRLKSLQDSVNYFDIITSMLAAGLTTYEVFEILSKYSYPESSREIFADIHQDLVNNRDYTEHFRRLGLNEFTIFILKMGKEIQDIKKSFNDAFISVQDYSDSKFNEIKEIVDFISFIIMVIVFMYGMSFIFFGTIDVSFI